MKKFIFFLIIIAVALFFLDDFMSLSVSAMGNEITFSLAFLIGIFFLLLLAWHLIRKPFLWLKNWRLKKKQQQEQDKQTILINALINVLAHQEKENKIILNKSIKLWGKDSEIPLIIQGLFYPDSKIFTQMTHLEKLSLAGFYGLYQEAVQQGNMEECALLLNKVKEKYPDTPWILKGLYELAVWDKDWEEAKTLLKHWQKITPLSEEFLNQQQALIAFNTGHTKEAFHLDPTNPQIVLAYVQKEPKKAVAILQESWNLTPQWILFQKLLSVLKPLANSKKEKIILDFTDKNPMDKLSLLAKAVFYIQVENWQMAEEILNIYLESFPLTKPVAQMMAVINQKKQHTTEAEAWLKKERTALPASYPCLEDFEEL